MVSRARRFLLKINSIISSVHTRFCASPHRRPPTGGGDNSRLGNLSFDHFRSVLGNSRRAFGRSGQERFPVTSPRKPLFTWGSPKSCISSQPDRSDRNELRKSGRSFFGRSVPCGNTQMLSKIGNPHVTLDARKSRFHDFRPPSRAMGNVGFMEKLTKIGLPPVLLGVTMSDFYPMLGVNFVFCF